MDCGRGQEEKVNLYRIEYIIKVQRSVINRLDFFYFPIDNYIGFRYNQYNGSRYNVRRYIELRYIGGALMMNNKETITLTEAVYYILISLQQPLHGYGIMQNVERLSNGRVRLAAGTLYGAINTLLERRWIKAFPVVDNSRKKEYIITDLGKETVQDELIRLKELVENGNCFIGGAK